MPITINGSGTLTGLSAGGLPDGVVAPADLTTGAPSWDSSGNLSFNSGYGSVAPVYGCRAWVNFNGTGTVAIRASGNVSSITDNGTGAYTVNYAASMPDANYSLVANAQDTGMMMLKTLTAGNTLIYCVQRASTVLEDSAFVTVAVFR